MIILHQPISFNWDQGNKGKNYVKHKVTDQECEEAFFDPSKKLSRDIIHSGEEERYILLGQTKEKRTLFVIFTMRTHKMRVISARDLNKREIKLYE